MVRRLRSALCGFGAPDIFVLWFSQSWLALRALSMTVATYPDKKTKTLNVVVNGIAAVCPDGGRVLDAVRAAGTNVPTLCFDERTGPKGTCRACLVEVSVPDPSLGPGGTRKQTVAACTWLAADGMAVATHTPELREYRRTLFELLLSETAPPANCPKCATTGPCEFHAACTEYGAKSDRFKPLARRTKADDPNPFIQRDYSYCIACYRCTNICNEWEQASAITVDGRGQSSKIYTRFNNRLLESPCTFCGQCINTCPTGALTDRKALTAIRDLTATHPLPPNLPLPAGEGWGEGEAAKSPLSGKERAWVRVEAAKSPLPGRERVGVRVKAAPGAGRPALKRTKTICPYCGVGCGIHLLSGNGQVVGVEPDFTAPSRGSLCVKGQFASWEFVRSEDRLRYPLIRVSPRRVPSIGSERTGGDDTSPQPSPARREGVKGAVAPTRGEGQQPVFRRATWDEALDLVASRLKGIIASDGPDAVVCWASARVVNEANYLMQKFARVAIGTNNIDNCSRT